LGGYLRLAEMLATDLAPPCVAFNFGPTLANNRRVSELVTSILEHWPGEWLDQSDPTAPHEANLLHLQIDKAHHLLGWKPCWDYAITLARTVGWYRAVNDGATPLECCLSDLNFYNQSLISTHE
jgi:CDP-glucose 4,6-dehydratase